MTRSAVLLREEAHDAQQMLRAGSSEMPGDARLLRSEEWRQLNGIDGSYRQELADELPSRWTADHLTKRLLEATKTIERLQAPKAPRHPGNHWPQYPYDRADLNCQMDLPDAEKRARYEEYIRKWMSVKVSPEELMQADRIQDWLRTLKEERPNEAAILRHWLVWKIKRHKVRDMCDQLGWSVRHVYRYRDRAIDWLVSRLNERLVIVF